MGLRTPLAQAHGLGSAKEGVGHWWHQRLTAIALVPLTIWLTFSVALLGTADYYTVVYWLEAPVNAALMMLAIAVAFWHGALGIQVIVEDYVGTEWLRMVLVILVQFAAVVLALGGILAVLLIVLGV